MTEETSKFYTLHARDIGNDYEWTSEIFFKTREDAVLYLTHEREDEPLYGHISWRDDELEDSENVLVKYKYKTFNLGTKDVCMVETWWETEDGKQFNHFEYKIETLKLWEGLR